MKQTRGLKPGKALICGSMAFDTIMVFADRFRNHILPDKLHMLNVSFLTLQMRREFGGCAGNIAYNLRLLGDPGYVMATVGHDFGPYAEWMDRQGVPRDYLRVVTRRAHRPGVHHHRPGQQPDHGLSSRRHGPLAPEPRDGSQRRCHRHRGPGRPRRHAAACAAVRRGRHSVHLRSRPGTAHVRWRRAARLHRAGDLGGDQ